jgi:hypothetical protein
MCKTNHVSPKSNHLQSSNLLVPVQSAYRPDHSTETALRVMNNLLMAVDGGNAAILALLVQSAAFDTIDHSVLLDRLSTRFGICGSALDWFSSDLANRSQSVQVFGVTSPPIFLTCGVPQGSVLGPVMFTLYNSPIHDIAVHHGISDQYYADNTDNMLNNTRPSSRLLMGWNNALHILLCQTVLVRQGNGCRRIG